MPGITLYMSNRLEILAENLAGVLGTPLSSPLEPEVVVVQSRGMARWLSMQLAGHLGICANFRFPFPNRFVQDLFQRVIPHAAEHSPFDVSIMAWRIAERLPHCIHKPGFEHLRSYLETGGEDLKSFQLSERIADLFDQYLLFRPDMIERWEKGWDAHWQAVLWRTLMEGTDGWHRASLGKAFLEKMESDAGDTGGFPERITVFGISALPPFHMQVLYAISRVSSIGLFLVNPCREYWGDIIGDLEWKRMVRIENAPEKALPFLHLEKGNSLLATMGTLGRHFFDLVSAFPCSEETSYEDPGRDTLLSCVQSDILNLREKSQDGARGMLRAGDDSIQIHVCHSPLREMEALHDVLLGLFEKDPTLHPRDVLVMMPDIESYSPCIQAVFDDRTDDARKIPYSIADRSLRHESGIVDAFLAVLGLPGSRFTAAQVFHLLECPSVRRKFGLQHTDLDLIRKWIRHTRTRWGMDGAHRGRLGLPAFHENTWEAGLERLFLGYAMAGAEDGLFKGRLPYGEMEGQETRILGCFSDFVGTLFSLTEGLTNPQTLETWAGYLRQLVEKIFAPDETTDRDLEVIRGALNQLEVFFSVEGAGFRETVNLRVIRWLLEGFFQKEGYGFGFMTGGVTFCAMLPMRSIPFKVIVLAGMNDDAYPRETKVLGFDLMARNPRPGDRSRRHDDRYLFLEALLSARQKVFISYVGQSIRDNSPRPPSVLVTELTDYVTQNFKPAEGGRDSWLVHRHRLQSFSPHYFKKDTRLFSYSHERCELARALAEPRQDPPSFITRGLTAPPEEARVVALSELVQFFTHPCRFLLNRRLDLYLREDSLLLEDEEPFEVKNLERYVLENDLLEQRLAGRELGECRAVKKASGVLPPGAPGGIVYEKLTRGIEAFARKTEAFLKKGPLPPAPLNLEISGFRLTGELRGIYPERMLSYRYARVKAKDRIGAWIRHLALNAFKEPSYPKNTLFMGLVKTPDGPAWAGWEFSPVEGVEAVLSQLLETYWKGLRRPLHFFPESSWAYAYQRLQKGKTEEEALEAARRSWEGGDFARGEKQDAYYDLCFRTGAPLDEAFQKLSERVFGPLMAHLNSRESKSI